MNKKSLQLTFSLQSYIKYLMQLKDVLLGDNIGKWLMYKKYCHKDSDGNLQQNTLINHTVLKAHKRHKITHKLVDLWNMK